MKSIIASLAIILMVCHVSAQTLDSIPHIGIGEHHVFPACIMQMADSTILGSCIVFEDQDSNYSAWFLNRISRHGAHLIENIYAEHPDGYEPYTHLLAKNQKGDGYVFAEVFNDSENDYFTIRIMPFDDNLHFDTASMVTVCLGEFHAVCKEPGIILNPKGNLVVSYYEKDPVHPQYNKSTHFTEIGLDGTIIRSKSYNIDDMQLNRANEYGPKIISESPLRYCQWGQVFLDNPINQYIALNCYVLDSLFNIEAFYSFPESVSLPNHPFSLNTHCSWWPQVYGCSDGNILVSRGYYQGGHTTDYGILVQKFDQDANMLKFQKFQAVPLVSDGYSNITSIGMERSHDGCVFFSCATNSVNTFDAYGNLFGQIMVAKMNENLDIIWQRYCLEQQGYARHLGRMVVLNDDGVAIMGTNDVISYMESDELFFLIISDDYDALEEQGIIVRPYAYWPNPAQDELHLQFSPDVTPTQIELYDLQGRMVRSQRNGLESINLEGLASGTYTMRVTLEGGKVFSDKVVKN